MATDQACLPCAKDTLLGSLVENNDEGFPMTADDAVDIYGDDLSPYEKKEIIQYPEVWYLGHARNQTEGRKWSGFNNGFDDKSGRYVPVIGDHIAYRYEVEETMGMGIASQVLKCYDHKNHQPVAIKVIRNRRKIHLQALIETKMLSKLNKHDRNGKYNIINMITYFYFRNHLCIVFELMGINLYDLLKVHDFQGLNMDLIRTYALSIVQSLSLLHRESIIHCDLKPENVVIDLQSPKKVKVVDFGSSCYNTEKIYTYIQSRYYRSPEVILGLPYDMSVDMWSLGAMLAELYSGHPLFPGENETDLLSCIMEILGLPPQTLLCEAVRRSAFFDDKGSPIYSKGCSRWPGAKLLSEAVNTKDELFLDFLHKCLVWDPTKRMTPTEALQHKWILQSNQDLSSSTNNSN